MHGNNEWSKLETIQNTSPDWSVKKLIQFSNKQKNSFVNGPFGSDLLSTELVEHGVPVVYIRDIKDGRYQRKSTCCVTDEKATSLVACKTSYGDVIITKVGDPPCEAAVYSDKVDAVVTQDVIRIKTTDVWLSYFIVYLLNSDIGRRQIKRIKIEGTRERVSLTDFKKIKFVHPSDKEQQKIAQILSTWDKAIEKLEVLVAAKQKRKKALMQQLLTGKKRFSGFDGEWEETEIGKMISESKISSTSNNPANRLTVRLNFNGIEHREFRGTESLVATAHFVRKAGQFIYGKQNFHKGAFGIIPEKFDFFETSQDIPSFDFLKNCNGKWFFYYCSQDWFYIGIEDFMTGTGSKRLNPKVFQKIKIPFPPIEEQQKIASVLSAADIEIQTHQKQLSALKEQKKGLMQQLLTGKKRVKIDEPELLAVAGA